MKLTLLLLIFTTFLSSSEFKYIQPIAVEEAPPKEVIVIIQEEIPEEVVVQEEEPLFEDDTTVQYDDEIQDSPLVVHFETNRYNIASNYAKEIEEFALYLKEHSESLILIYGYADSDGEEIANKLLSYNRANSLKKALEGYGVPSIKITAIGRGITEPIADNTTQDGRAKNRRAQVDILE